MLNTLAEVPIVLWSEQSWASRSNLALKFKFTPFWACPHHDSSPIQARTTKFGPEVKITMVLGAIDLDLQRHISPKSQIFRFHYYWKYITTTKPPESPEYLDCFTGLTASWFPSSACTYIPRLFHESDCFTVSTRCSYIDLGSWWYFGV